MRSALRLLITGASGFVGRHTLEAARARLRDWSLTAWYQGLEPTPADHLQWSAVDLEDPQAVAAAAGEAKPTHVLHLAAVADVGGSFTSPHRTFSVNTMGTLNLLEGLMQEAPGAKVLIVSSADVYGDSFKSGAPLDEEAPVSPQNPYAASKAAAELIAQSYRKLGLHLVIARPFNHIGPGQSEHFAVSAFARQVARIEAGLQPPRLEVGNLEAARDFSDVRDIVAGYLSALERMERLTPGLVLNFCSGVSRRIGDVLHALLAASGACVEITQDPARMRPSDIRFAAGNPARVQRLLDWRPERAWNETLESTLADWRNRVAADQAG
jgi:GDP-4-dehydro-6-deoxy-D-mannose reductase